jgi:hypothetical protein
MNLDQLYDRMRTIKEKNEKLLEAKKLLKTSGESRSRDKEHIGKKLPLAQKISDPDST